MNLESKYKTLYNLVTNFIYINYKKMGVTFKKKGYPFFYAKNEYNNTGIKTPPTKISRVLYNLLIFY